MAHQGAAAITSGRGCTIKRSSGEGDAGKVTSTQVAHLFAVNVPGVSQIRNWSYGRRRHASSQVPSLIGAGCLPGATSCRRRGMLHETPPADVYIAVGIPKPW